MNGKTIYETLILFGIYSKAVASVPYIPKACFYNCVIGID